MPEYFDQLGRTVILPRLPQRIVSLVPSQTELLYSLGLERETVGITKFCIRPPDWFRNKIRVGGTKTIDLEKLRTLRPDLIIANKEENEREQVETLAREFPVWISDVPNLSAALDMIGLIGELTGKGPAASDLTQRIRAGFDDLSGSSAQAWFDDLSGRAGFHDLSGRAGFHDLSRLPVPPRPRGRPLRAAYFIWRDPWMAAGGDTFIDNMLGYCGLQNLFGHLSRYPTVDPLNLAGMNADLILLSSEPYPFKEKHIDEMLRVIPNASVMLVNCEMFSWYGSRLLEAPAYFGELARLFPTLPK